MKISFSILLSIILISSCNNDQLTPHPVFLKVYRQGVPSPGIENNPRSHQIVYQQKIVTGLVEMSYYELKFKFPNSGLWIIKLEKTADYYKQQRGVLNNYRGYLYRDDTDYKVEVIIEKVGNGLHIRIINLNNPKNWLLYKCVKIESKKNLKRLRNEILKLEQETITIDELF